MSAASALGEVTSGRGVGQEAGALMVPNHNNRLRFGTQNFSFGSYFYGLMNWLVGLFKNITVRSGQFLNDFGDVDLLKHRKMELCDHI